MLNADMPQSGKLQPGPVPLYYRLQADLYRRIRSGEFRPGAMLPPEERLCADYGVSRITVRRALEELRSSRLIYRQRGRGTFVSRPDETLKSVTLTGSLEDLLSFNSQLSYRVLGTDLVPPPAPVAEALRLEPGDTARRFETVNHLAGEPFAYAEFFFPEPVASAIEAEDFAGSSLPIRVVEARVGQRVARGEQTIDPVLANDTVAMHLGIDAGSPLLQVSRVYYSEIDEPMEAVVVRYHPARYRFTVRLLASQDGF